MLHELKIRVIASNAMIEIRLRFMMFVDLEFRIARLIYFDKNYSLFAN